MVLTILGWCTWVPSGAFRLKVIKHAHPKLYCIVLVDTPTEMQRALSAGADGVLLRDSLSENLLSTLEDIGMPDPQANEGQF